MKYQTPGSQFRLAAIWRSILLRKEARISAADFFPRAFEGFRGFNGEGFDIEL